MTCPLPDTVSVLKDYQEAKSLEFYLVFWMWKKVIRKQIVVQQKINFKPLEYLENETSPGGLFIGGSSWDLPRLLDMGVLDECSET